MPSMSTFMPYKPEITVGTAINRVTEVRYFIALFRRLSKIEMTSIYRDDIKGTRELFSSILDNRLNNAMKKIEKRC